MDLLNPPGDDQGGGEPPQDGPPTHLKPGQTFAEATQVAGIVSGGIQSSRTFEEIIKEEQKNWNILEIILTRTDPNAKNMNLTFDDLSIFIFDIMKIKHQECEGIDYTTGRYDSREVQLKPGVDLTPYLTGNTPFCSRITTL